MASSKYLFSFCLFVLVHLLPSTIALRSRYFVPEYTFKIDAPPPYTPFDQDCSGLPRLSRNGTNIALVQVKDVVRSLRDHGGYDLIAMMLERNLRHDTFPFCGRDFAFFVDRRNRITFYGRNPTVTLFVPSDDSLRFENWADLGYQIAMAKIDQEAFLSGDLSEGSKFDTAGFSTRRLVVDRVFENGNVSINGVNIKEWDIYNDGNIIVHGTDQFFNYFRGGEERVPPFLWAKFRSIPTYSFEMKEDPKTGAYFTYKMSPAYKNQKPPKHVKLSSIRLLL